MVSLDHEFLTHPGPVKERHFIYFVRSGLLTLAIKKRIIEIAGGGDPMEKAVLVDELPASLCTSFFANEVMFCEVNTRSQFAKLTVSLELIAEPGDLTPFCIIVEGQNDFRSLPIWPSIEKRCVVLEEPLVSSENVSGILRFLVQWNDLNQFPSNEHEAAFRLIRASLKNAGRPLREISQQLDLLMLSPTFARDFAQQQKGRSDVLNECIMKFLVEPYPSSMRRLLKVVDAMKTEKLKEPADIIADLYHATEKALRGTDMRYHHNKKNSAPPIHFLTWALRLLSYERALMSASLLEALDRLCREFMVTNDSSWLEDPTNFKKAFHACLKPESSMAARRGALFDAVCGVAGKLISESPGARGSVARLVNRKNGSAEGHCDERL